MRASRSHANDLRPVSAGKFGAGPDRRCVWHFHPRGEKACRTRHGPSDERNEGRAMSQDDRAMTDLTAEDTASETAARSEEHTSALQSLMRISYAVFCLKKKNNKKQTTTS